MKKVLSLVLTLALVLSSFSMAFADDAKKDEAKPEAAKAAMLSDIAGNANEEAIGVVNDLGIVTGNPDGTFQPEKAVTRAEYAAMITRALAIPQSALAGYASTSFKDTDGYGWAVGYLAFCNSKGIMLGDGQGNAMPGKTITLNEAMTMALRAIGYTANSAELKGNWPANYVTKAQELNLYEELAKDIVGVDKANAAQLIYNILTKQKVAVNSDGKTEKIWDTAPSTTTPNGVETTLLSSGLNCKKEDVRVVEKGDLSDSLINMAKHLGKNGTIYRNNKTKNIVAFIVEDNTQLVGRFTEGNTTAPKAPKTFVTTDGEKEYSISADAFDVVASVPSYKATKIFTQDAVRVKNSNDYDHADNFGPYGANTPGSVEYVLNVDLSGKTIKHVYSAIEYKVSRAKKVSASDLATIKRDHKLLGYEFIEDDNKEIDATQFVLVGVSSLDDIKADDLVYIYANADKEIRRIEVSNQVVEGVVKNFRGAKTDIAPTFKVEDKVYKNAKDVLNGTFGSVKTIDDSNIGDTVKLFLDARGYVYDSESVTRANNFAVIEKAASGINDEVKLRLADGTAKVFNYDNAKKKAGQLKPLEGGLIGYGLNKDGEIVDSNRFYVKADVKIVSKSFLKDINVTEYTHYKKYDDFATSTADGTDTVATYMENAFNSGAPATAELDDKCVIFTVDKDGDYGVSSIDKLETGNDVVSGVILLYDEKKNGTADTSKVVAMIITDKKAKDADKSYAVINAVDKGYNGSDKVQEVDLYIGKELMKDVKTDSESTVTWIKPNYANFVNAADFAGSPFDSTSELGLYVYEIKKDKDGVLTEASHITKKDTGSEHYVAAFAVFNDDPVTKYVNKDANVGYAISSNAVFYEVTDKNEFDVYNGELEKGDIVMLYETSDDNEYDIVLVKKKV